MFLEAQKRLKFQTYSHKMSEHSSISDYAKTLQFVHDVRLEWHKWSIDEPALCLFFFHFCFRLLPNRRGSFSPSQLRNLDKKSRLEVFLGQSAIGVFGEVCERPFLKWPAF